MGFTWYNENKQMKKVFLSLGCLCLSLVASAQSYRGSDADRMMYERMRQHSQQNSSSNTYVPQRSYNNYNNRSYNNNSYGNSYGQSGIHDRGICHL